MKHIYILLFTLILMSCSEKNNEQVITNTNQVIVLTKAEELKEIENTILTQPNNYEGYLKRAKYRLNKFDLDLAYEDIDLAIKVAPENAEVNYTKGLILYNLSKIDMAVAFLERSVKLDSNHVDALLKLGYINLTIPNLEEGLYYINRVLKIDKYRAEPYYLKGMWYEIQQNYPLASSSYQTAIERNPDYYEAYLAQGDLHNKLNKQIAVDYYKSAIRIKPNSIEAWRTLGISYKNHDQFEEALICFDTILTIDSTFEVAHFDAGVTYLNLCYDDNSKSKNDSLINIALTRFNAALKINKNYVPAKYNRGLCYEELGDKAKAKLEYQDVLKLEPNYEEAIKGMNRL